MNETSLAVILILVVAAAVAATTTLSSKTSRPVPHLQLPPQKRQLSLCRVPRRQPRRRCNQVAKFH